MFRRTIGAAVGAILVAFSFPMVAGAQDSWFPSKYGAGDTVGAINNLSAEAVVSAAKLVKDGKVYSLAIPTGPDTPAFGDRSYRVEAKPAVLPRNPGSSTPEPDLITGHDELVTTSFGIGTQMDGLGHIGINHRYYNGLTEDQIRANEALRVVDFANLPPIAGRGVLVDMARYYGKSVLQPGTIFTSVDIKAALKRQGLALKKGDVVLFHTGWMSILESDKAKYAAAGPGIGVEAAEWLADQGVVAVGADTIALEANPSGPDKRIEVHQTLLAKNGVYILENIDTRHLAADRAYEFLFVLGPPRFVGTAQVVVNPIAIR